MLVRTGHHLYTQAHESVADGSADGENVASRSVIRLAEAQPDAAIRSGDHDQTCLMRHVSRVTVSPTRSSGHALPEAGGQADQAALSSAAASELAHKPSEHGHVPIFACCHIVVPDCERNGRPRRRHRWAADHGTLPAVSASAGAGIGVLAH